MVKGSNAKDIERVGGKKKEKSKKSEKKELTM